jgi:hypothetical protein
LSDEDRARTKLKQARLFLEDGQKADAADYCRHILAKYPQAVAAAEAKEILAKLR